MGTLRGNGEVRENMGVRGKWGCKGEWEYKNGSVEMYRRKRNMRGEVGYSAKIRM